MGMDGQLYAHGIYMGFEEDTPEELDETSFGTPVLICCGSTSGTTSTRKMMEALGFHNRKGQDGMIISGAEMLKRFPNWRDEAQSTSWYGDSEQIELLAKAGYQFFLVLC